jgi:hypothetical protein
MSFSHKRQVYEMCLHSSDLRNQIAYGPYFLLPSMSARIFVRICLHTRACVRACVRASASVCLPV